MKNKIFSGNIQISPDITEPLLNRIKENKTTVIIQKEGQHFIGERFGNHGTVYLFGAGHVSQVVCEFAKKVDFRVIVLDDREKFCNVSFFDKADKLLVIKNFNHLFSGLRIHHDSYLVILTRGNLHDEKVLAQALKTNSKYIGMIGSRRKRDIIYNNLLKDGFNKRDIERVFSPAGLDIGAETPEEIAVSIVGELIRKRSNSLKKNRIF